MGDPVAGSPIDGPFLTGLFGDDGGDQGGLACSLVPPHNVHEIKWLPTAFPSQADQAKQPGAGQLLRQQRSIRDLQHDQGLHDMVEFVLVGVRPERVQRAGREQSCNLEVVVDRGRLRAGWFVFGPPRRRVPVVR